MFNKLNYKYGVRNGRNISNLNWKLLLACEIHVFVALNYTNARLIPAVILLRCFIACGEAHYSSWHMMMIHTRAHPFGPRTHSRPPLVLFSGTDASRLAQIALYICVRNSTVPRSETRSQIHYLRDIANGRSWTSRRKNKRAWRKQRFLDQKRKQLFGRPSAKVLRSRVGGCSDDVNNIVNYIPMFSRRIWNYVDIVQSKNFAFPFPNF